MPFKPVNKEEMNKNLARVSVNLDLVGESATAFKKACEDAKISGKSMIVQMAEHCLDEMASATKK